MSTQAPNRQSAPPVRGSWEALLTEARQLALRDDERAGEKYELLIGRLVKMPLERLAANDNRMQRMLEECLFTYQSFLARRNRLQEAIDLHADQLVYVFDADATAVWNERQAYMLSWLERHDESLALMAKVQAETPWDISLRWQLFEMYRKQGRTEAMLGLIEDLEGLLEALESHGLTPPDEAISVETLQGLVRYLKMMNAIEQGEWQAAYDNFVEAASVSDAYKENWHQLFRLLVLNGESKLANRALNRETSPASQGFWRGLNGYYQGDKAGSKTEWEQVTRIPIDDLLMRSAADWILANYYLGDPKRLGLQLALRLIENMRQNRDPLIIALAGLGWAIQGEYNHLKMNIEFAIGQLRGSFNGNKLPEFNWYFFRDLLPAEEFAKIEHYFEVPRGRAA
ncbi:MAG: hypothetical protein KF753_05685 [Caldilineaceae bacterium]|nr:hypothetical protein [Caldilineaceae bacterium]